MDVGRDWVRCAVADLSGWLVGRRDVPNRARSADGLVGTVAGLAHEVVADAGLTWEQVVHTLIGSPGVFNPGSGRLLFASNLPGWGRAGLVEDLRRALRASLDVENDANVAAIGEHAFGAGAAVGSFVFLTVGTGVGMGIVVDGRLYRGASGAAGEVAYLPIGADGTPGAPAPSGRDVSRRGLLEEATAADAVMRTAAALGGVAEGRSAQAVFAAARRGDPTARAAVMLEGQRLALAVASVAAILDPELVVLGGGIGRNLDLLREPLARRLHEVTPLRPDIVVSALGEEAVLRGAIATALEVARDMVFERRAGSA